jgi:AbrB family looped-hinge helix DNA binding protein
MRALETSKIGKRGLMVIPARLRKKLGLVEGAYVIAEEHPEGILLRPAALVPVELYTAHRKAEMLLGNATNAREYAAALAEVKAMGIDPAKVNHFKPRGVR